MNRTPLLIALGLINDNDKVGDVKIKFEENYSKCQLKKQQELLKAESNIKEQ